MLKKLWIKLKYNWFIAVTPYIDKNLCQVYQTKSTKKCPICGNKNLLLFTSLDEKICTDCNLHFEWKLEKHQKKLF